jgi:hypothetical protein
MLKTADLLKKSVLFFIAKNQILFIRTQSPNLELPQQQVVVLLMNQYESKSQQELARKTL